MTTENAAGAHQAAPTSIEYIQHHLTHLKNAEGTINLDTFWVSAILGLIFLGVFYMASRKATAGVPGKLQNFVEAVMELVNEVVNSAFHAKSKVIAPLAITIFCWVWLMNAMDFLPVDFVAMITGALGAHHGFRIVPTADVSTTFALALSVWVLMIGFAIKVKGAGGFVHELFCAPFGSNPLLWPLNFLFNLVEYISKPLSHSLRLFGNMYAGEIIFLLLWLMAGVGLVGSIAAFFLGLGWAIFHILIVALQAYIFMMLTIVYIQMAHEGH